KTALMLILADDWGSHSLIESLLAAGADVDLKDKDGYSALNYAIKNDNFWYPGLFAKSKQKDRYSGPVLIDLIKMISDFKRDHQNSVTPQFFLRRIKDLLAVGINVNGQDEKGKTALMAAASEGNIEL